MELMELVDSADCPPSSTPPPSQTVEELKEHQALVDNYTSYFKSQLLLRTH